MARKRTDRQQQLADDGTYRSASDQKANEHYMSSILSEIRKELDDIDLDTDPDKTFWQLMMLGRKLFQGLDDEDLKLSDEARAKYKRLTFAEMRELWEAWISHQNAENPDFTPPWADSDSV